MLFFFNDTATTEIYTLSLHDALPIYPAERRQPSERGVERGVILDRPDLDRRVLKRAGAQLQQARRKLAGLDRKSTRLNSSHANISYAVFCLKKKIKRAYS